MSPLASRSAASWMQSAATGGVGNTGSVGVVDGAPTHMPLSWVEVVARVPEPVAATAAEFEEVGPAAARTHQPRAGSREPHRIPVAEVGVELAVDSRSTAAATRRKLRTCAELVEKKEHSSPDFAVGWAD